MPLSISQAYLRFSALKELDRIMNTLQHFFGYEKESMFDIYQTMALQMKITKLGRKYFQGCQF